MMMFWLLLVWSCTRLARSRGAHGKALVGRTLLGPATPETLKKAWITGGLISKYVWKKVLVMKNTSVVMIVFPASEYGLENGST